MANQQKRVHEFMRLFEKTTGRRLTEDEASWHLERLVQLYGVLLRGKAPETGQPTNENAQSASEL